MRLELLAFWRLPREEPQERLVLWLDFLAGYAEDFGSLSGPGTNDVFTLAIVIVGGIVVTQPLGAIAHFRHRPHWGRRLAKSPLRRQPRKKGVRSRDAIRQILADRLLQRLARQNLAYCVSAHFSSRAISRLCTVLGVANSSPGMRPLPKNYLCT